MNNHHSRRGFRRSARRSGSSLVEFALVGSIMCSLAMGMLQFGVIMQTSIVLSQVSRDAARWVAAAHYGDSQLSGSCSSTSTDPDDLNTNTLGCFVRQGLLVNTMIPRSDFTNGYMTVSATPSSGLSAGDPVKIVVTYNMRRKFFLPTTFPGLARFNTTAKTQTTMVCLRSN